MERPPRERLRAPRERLDTKEPRPNGIFVVKHPTKNLYLQRLVYTDMKEDEKWKPLSWATTFLSTVGAGHMARRMLGHNDFVIVPKPEEN